MNKHLWCVYEFTKINLFPIEFHIFFFSLQEPGWDKVSKCLIEFTEMAVAGLASYVLGDVSCGLQLTKKLCSRTTAQILYGLHWAAMGRILSTFYFQFFTRNLEILHFIMNMGLRVHSNFELIACVRRICHRRIVIITEREMLYRPSHFMWRWFWFEIFFCYV